MKAAVYPFQNGGESVHELRQAAEPFPTGETNMSLQNRRSAALLVALQTRSARVACALAAFALSALLLACVGARGLTGPAAVAAAQERFEGQGLRRENGRENA